MIIHTYVSSVMLCIIHILYVCHWPFSYTLIYKLEADIMWNEALRPPLQLFIPCEPCTEHTYSFNFCAKINFPQSCWHICLRPLSLPASGAGGPRPFHILMKGTREKAAGGRAALGTEQLHSHYFILCDGVACWRCLPTMAWHMAFWLVYTFRLPLKEMYVSWVGGAFRKNKVVFILIGR